MKKTRFTLIEVLVATAIIGVLVGLSLSSLNDARLRGKFARWLGYKTNLKADSSLLAYYDFQQPEGSVLKNQAFGINIERYNQRLVDAAIYNASWTKGRWRNKGSLWMNGVDSYAVIPADNKIVNIPKEFSVEFWFLPITLNRGVLLQSNATITDNSTTVQEIKDGVAGSNDDIILSSFVLAINNQNLELNYIADLKYNSHDYAPVNAHGQAYAWGTKVVSLDIERQDLTFNCNFKAEQWYHIILAYSFDNQRIKLYLNGELKQEYTESRPVIYLFGQTWLGGTSVIGNSFNGIIDEFALYNRALTLYDAKAHYAMGKP